MPSQVAAEIKTLRGNKIREMNKKMVARQDHSKIPAAGRQKKFPTWLIYVGWCAVVSTSDLSGSQFFTIVKYGYFNLREHNDSLQYNLKYPGYKKLAH